MANSKKRCLFCGEYGYTPDMIKVGLSYFCNFSEAVKHATSKDNIDKGKKIAESNARKEMAEKRKAEKLERQSLAKRKRELRPYTWYEKKAQEWFNRFIRLRDRTEGCISCDRSLEEIEKNDGWKCGGCWDAGHFLTRGAHPELRFNEDNCHKQCKSCNGGSGKYSRKASTVGKMYRIKLIEKIGIDRVEALEVDQVKKKPSIEELKEIIEIYKEKCREIKLNQD